MVACEKKRIKSKLSLELRLDGHKLESSNGSVLFRVEVSIYPLEVRRLSSFAKNVLGCHSTTERPRVLPGSTELQKAGCLMSMCQDTARDHISLVRIEA